MHSLTGTVISANIIKLIKGIAFNFLFKVHILGLQSFSQSEPRAASTNPAFFFCLTKPAVFVAVP